LEGANRVQAWVAQRSGLNSPAMIIITDSRCAQYASPGHPERPERISRTVLRLQDQKELGITWAAPLEPDDQALLRAHTAEHLRNVREARYDFDGDTPAYPEIYMHALRSVGGALHALQLAREGKTAFSLLRPPGHHATQDRAMGFCYLNSIAIAVLEALTTGTSRVAVFDFDVHHGNGTEAILLDHPNCVYFSVHQHPAYPGTGAHSFQNSRNFPVPPGASREDYLAALEQALLGMRRFKPELIAVSAGFDAYRHDPLSYAALDPGDFYWLGEQVRQLGVPAFSVLEGGYSSDLPELIFAYMQGLSGV
jgi:acetoin utilization deacetylase AcuC-like enzyme